VLVPICPSRTSESPTTTEGQNSSPSACNLSAEAQSASILAPLRLPDRRSINFETSNTDPSARLEHQADEGISPPSVPEEAPREAAVQPKLFITNLREATALVVKDVRSFVVNEDISPARRALTIGGALVAVVASAAHSIPWGLGALGFVVAKLGGTLRENRHNAAKGAIQGAILSGHFAGIGAEPMATGFGIWAGRMLLQSMIPESRKVLSAMIATTGIGVSCALFCASPSFIPELALHNVPLAAIILSGIASALPNTLSGVSQAIHLTCNSFMLPYHCAISGSWFLAALTVVWGHGNLRNILKHTPSEGSDKTPASETITRES